MFLEQRIAVQERSTDASRPDGLHASKEIQAEMMNRLSPESDMRKATYDTSFVVKMTKGPRDFLLLGVYWAS